MSGSCVELRDDSDQELWITEELISHMGSSKTTKLQGRMNWAHPLLPLLPLETAGIAGIATDDAF